MSGRLLFVLPSIIRMERTGLAVDADFAEGIKEYLRYYDELRIACPVTVDVKDSGLRRAIPVQDLPDQFRVKIISLPTAYHPADFIKHFARVRSSLRSEVAKSDILIASPHSFVGDWPTVAINEAIKQKVPYVIEADTSYAEVASFGWLGKAAWKIFIKKRIELPLLQISHRCSLRNSRLALLQGQDAFELYAPYCRNPHKVYHTTVSEADFVSPQRLELKVQSLSERRPLKICYAGRAIDLKGPFDWLNAIHGIVAAGTDIQSTWLGDGSLLPAMKETAAKLGISSHVNFRGYVSEKADILETMRETDIFLFCHKMRESPRCLVEALASGCPIVGYISQYPKELVSKFGGGQFAQVGDWQSLVGIVLSLNNDRSSLAREMKAAAASASLFDRESVMRRRIELIKQAIPLGTAAAA
jgi:glycosyltransferase involved in cell wall biosynthesis